jgi:catechol 2,3-dioxygenase-like lactoylglutathione lyase family enzyme
MATFDKLIRFHMAVGDMDLAKEFYTEKLGFNVVNEITQDGDRWAFLALPNDAVSVLLTTESTFMKPGTMKLYLTSPDVEAAYQELSTRGVGLPSPVKHDRWATWFDFLDPEGNRVVVTG